jgi:carbon monoxide dehydrogenase subunit G
MTALFVSLFLPINTPAIDGNTNIDAVFANYNETNRVCLGDGSGGFTCSDVSADVNWSFGVALGFVDGDTNLDAVFANFQTNRVCLGDGSGGFTCSDVSPEMDNSKDVSLGFVNGDTNLDAVFANYNEANRVCLGDGSGGFTCSDVGPYTNLSFGVALGFVDGDTNLDAVFANYNEANRVCLGDGSGGFTCSDVGPYTNLSFGVTLSPALTLNQPPVCNAGGPYVAECQGASSTLTLNGTGSSDPDNDPLSYSWWTTSCPGGSFDDPYSPTPILSVVTSSDYTVVCDSTLSVDDGQESDSCSRIVTIQDTTPPDIYCNAPTTIKPPDAPISFTATATDSCAGDMSVEIIGYDCFKFTKKGKRIDKKESCVVEVSGDTLTIVYSIGVGDNITWTVRAKDNSDNVVESTCSVVVVRPGKP